MIHIQNAKFVGVLPPISVAGGASATTTELDTVGFDYVALVIQSGLVGANGVPTVKLQESDTSGSGQADISGAALTALVDADDNEVFCIYVDMRKRKRYLTLVITNGATNASVMSALAILTRGVQTPATAAARGLTQQLFP